MKLFSNQNWKWCILILPIISGIDRLYWVNSGDGLTGWRNVSDVPSEYTACTGYSVEYKHVGVEVRYRCSIIAGDLPIWPLYSSGTAKLE